MVVARQPKISKDEVLALLREGKSIRSIFVDAGYKKASTYYDWRRADPDFRARADAILEGFDDPRKNQDARVLDPERSVEVDQPANDQPGTYDPEVGNWREAFCAEYRRTRSRIKAASLVGLGAGQVLDRLDESSDEFDSEFAALFEEVRLEEALAVEDRLIRRAIKDNDRHAIDKVLPMLPRIGEKYGKQARAEAGTSDAFAVILHVNNQNRAIETVSKMIDVVAKNPEIKEIAAPDPKASWTD